MRLSEFFCDVSGCVPPAIAEHHPEQADGELLQQRRCRCSLGYATEVVPTALAHEEPEQYKGRNNDDLDRREHVLHPSDEDNTDTVEECQYQNESSRERLCCTDLPGDAADLPSERRRLLTERREYECKVSGERQCGSGDRRGESSEERYPPAQESPYRPIGLSEIDILSTGCRKIDAEFGVAERARECEKGSHDPDAKHKRWLTQIPGEEPGRCEDPGSDHVRYDQRGGTPHSELSLQRWSGVRDYPRHGGVFPCGMASRGNRTLNRRCQSL